MIEVLKVNDRLRERYSAYLADKPGARFGHDLEWAQVLHDTYGAVVEHLIALEDEKAVGICPLFLCKPLWGGAHYQTSLFPSYFGPLYDSDAALNSLLDALVAKTAPMQYTEILAPEALPSDTRLPFKEQLDYTYRLSLEAGAEHVYSKFRRNYKRILRDPQYSTDLEIVVDSTGDLVGEFHRLYAQLYARKHGFIPHVENLFRNIFSHYQNGTARIYMARWAGKFIGGIFTFWKYGEIYCGWSAQDLDTEHLPMHFLIWKIMQDGAAQGYRWFNHGEAERDNENLNLFKQGWGMEASDPYRYFIPGLMPSPVVRLYDRFSWTKFVVSRLPARVTSSFISPLIRYFL